MYHSSFFIGNHCHAVCKDKKYELVTDAALSVVNEVAPENAKFQSMAADIKAKFTPLFGKFAECHLLFNSSKIVDPEILS